MENSPSDKKGAEILLDKYIEATIHESPLAFPELRKNIYDGLERVVKDDLEKNNSTFLTMVGELSPQQTTAYKILEKMGLIDLKTGFCYVTEQGLAIYNLLRRDGIYKDSEDRWKLCDANFD